MMEGQAWESSEAPVPIGQESPSARYRFFTPLTLPLSPEGERGLAFDVRERAPHFDLRLDAADDLGREVRGRGVAAEVGGADAVRDGLERRLVDRPRGAPRVLPLHV